MTNCALPAIPSAIEWVYGSDWFSSQKPTLISGYFYAWQGYWAKTIEKDQQFGKSLFNWGYAGPFACEAECAKWIESNNPEESLNILCLNGRFICEIGGQPEVSPCQPELALTRGLSKNGRPMMPLQRTKSFPTGNGIDPPWH
jgi:hypothetical protein